MAQSMLYIRGRFVLKTDYCTPNEIEEEKSRIKRARRAADRRANEQEDALIRRGVCPHCHLILPYNGKCDCGFERK